MCLLCRLPVAKKPQFWAHFDILGLLYRPPFADEGQIWCAIANPRCTHAYLPTCISIGSFCRPLCAKTPNFCRFLDFGMLSPIGSSLRKLNTAAQLKAFPYPTTSKSFLYSNAFMTKSGAQSLTFKSMTNKQTERQTKKPQRFWPPRRRVKYEPHQTWHGDRGHRARS